MSAATTFSREPIFRATASRTKVPERRCCCSEIGHLRPPLKVPETGGGFPRYRRPSHIRERDRMHNGR